MAHTLHLSDEVQTRYKEKINLIMGVDPYSLDMKMLDKQIEDFPKIHYFDIINYLQHAISPYTKEELRNVKSTEAYKFYTSGWVRDLGVKKMQQHILIMAQVMHSQRLNEKPLRPWAICKSVGEIICAHCTCVAGLGESCSHVGAMLFALEDAVRNVEPVSVTGKKAYWMMPSKKVGEPSTVQAMIFENKKQAVKDIDVEESVAAKKQTMMIVSEPSTTEKASFLKELVPHNSAILNVMGPHCFEIMAKQDILEKKFLSALYNDDHVGKPLSVLQNIAGEIDLTMTQEEYEKIEKQTRPETGNKNLWLGFRRGRITASLFKRACRTNPSKPSLSLIKQICYPESFNFSTEAVRYGCKHEKMALEEYKKNMTKAGHTNVKVTSVGLVLNEEYPHFGATPDSLVSCDCHEDACVEIKCPYCIRNINIFELKDLKKLCLRRENENLTLHREHSYFYQVQMQMALTKRRFCDFVVWSSVSQFTQRIEFDVNFWEEEAQKATRLHKEIILPELLAKYFSGKQQNEQEDVLWCICQQPDNGLPMIACDNINCAIVWFHFECLNLESMPDSPWYCNTCQRQV